MSDYLSDDEVKALGLEEPSGDYLSDDEVAKLGLEDAPAPTAQKTSVFDAFKNAAGNGFSKGWGDELADAMDPGAPAYRRLPDGSAAPYSTKNYLRDQRKLEADEHPWAAFGGNVVGELVSDAAAGALTKGALSPANPLGAAVLGALSGAGNADESTPGGTAGGAVIGTGAALGGFGIGKYALPAVMRGAGKAMSYIPNSVRKFAEERALKAAGPMLRDFRELAASGRVGEVGRDLLDEGLVKFGGTADDIAKRATARRAEVGSEIGEALGEADQMATGPSTANIADRIENEVLKPVMGSPTLQRFGGAIKDQVEAFRQMDAGQVKATTLNEWKRQLNDTLRWGADPNMPESFKRQISRILREEEEKLVDEAANRGGRAAEDFTENKRLYGNLAEVSEMAGDKALREQANRFVSPSDYGFGAAQGVIAAAGGASGGAASAQGMIMALAHKLARERGNSALAVTADMFANSAPLRWLSNLSGDQLGKYAAPLAEAAAKGNEAFSAAIYVLEMSDPAFRALKKVAEDESHAGGQTAVTQREAQTNAEP